VVVAEPLMDYLLMNVTISGIRNSSTEVENENGVYTIPTGITGDNFIVTAVAKDTDESEIQARVCVETIVMGLLEVGHLVIVRINF
jgi:hypothetical protein